MSSAAFSVPSNHGDRISIRRRGATPTSATSAAADAAIRGVIDRRQRRHRYGEDAATASVIGRIGGGVGEAVSQSVARFGLPHWLFRAAVVGFVATVLGGAAIGISLRQPTLHTVAGVVLLGAAPVPHTRVVFHPQGMEGGSPHAFTTAADGAFTSGSEPSLPAGLYAVAVEVGPNAPKLQKGVPAPYRTAATTPLRVHVTENLAGLKLLIRR